VPTKNSPALPRSGHHENAKTQATPDYFDSCTYNSSEGGALAVTKLQGGEHSHPAGKAPSPLNTLTVIGISVTLQTIKVNKSAPIYTFNATPYSIPLMLDTSKPPTLY
jgi:hypothetical protein